MDLAAQFNLQAKTKKELHGLYIDLFNKLADRKISKQNIQQAQSAMYALNNLICTMQ